MVRGHIHWPSLLVHFKQSESVSYLSFLKLYFSENERLYENTSFDF